MNSWEQRFDIHPHTDMEIIVIPVAAIFAFVVFAIVVGLMLCSRHRRRNRQQVRGPVMFPNTAFVSQQNVMMPMPSPNPQFQTPMPLTPAILNPNQYTVPMPVPQPFIPNPVIPNSSSLPNSSTSDLMDRMRQVQILMVEIHRLESSPGERNAQRIQELQQRVMELSNTDGHESVPVHTTPDSQPPPAYFPRDGKSGRG